MNDVVRYVPTGEIGVILIESPPVNALSQPVRAGLVHALEMALTDSQAKALVLTGGGRTFSAGADIREFGKVLGEPALSEVVARYEASSKPVVAAIHGNALGGGLEVALGCHYRVATPSAKLGLPEVKIGILPGAGGTQRLPRLIGVEQALEMIVSGEPVSGTKALELGLVDAVEEGEALDIGVRFAKRVLAEGRFAQPVSARNEKLANVDPAMFEAARARTAKTARNLFAPFKCIDAVAAAVQLPFAEGLKRERELFAECMASPQRAGLIHAFFAEREVAKIPGLPADTRMRPIDSAAVIGAGTMGGGIAMCFANAGIPVKLLDTTQAALDKGLAVVRRNYESSAAKGKLTTRDVEQRMALIQPTLSYDALCDVDLVVEAVFEEMDIKKKVFGALDAACKAGTILATNTSTLNVDEIAAATRRPQDVIGMHFFSPANVMKLLEVVRGAKTSNEVIATVMNLSKRIGKVGVLVGVCYGFVGNRMLHQRSAEATALVNEGASPQQVDKVLTDFGFPMGPFAMSDLAGIDVGWRIREGLRKSGNPDAPRRNWLDQLAEQGRFGQKTGAGVYRYANGSRTPIVDPEVDALIAAFRAEQGIKPRAVSDAEILERCLGVMINEGAKILEERIAARSLDIDVIWIHGYGFPSYRGGPMFWADQVGLPKILDTVRRYHDRLGTKAWRPAPLLEQLVRDGKGFRDF